MIKKNVPKKLCHHVPLLFAQLSFPKCLLHDITNECFIVRGLQNFEICQETANCHWNISKEPAGSTKPKSINSTMQCRWQEPCQSFSVHSPANVHKKGHERNMVSLSHVCWSASTSLSFTGRFKDSFPTRSRHLSVLVAKSNLNHSWLLPYLGARRHNMAP